MTDREMLELAAKAAGYVPATSDAGGPFVIFEGSEARDWNPREDDGDCARLEAALRLTILWMDGYVTVVANGHCLIVEEYGLNSTADQRQAARRNAVTRVAAEIGEAEKQKPVVFTTGHCQNKKMPGGCQLHNLQCGYPTCDRKLVDVPKGATP